MSWTGPPRPAPSPVPAAGWPAPRRRRSLLLEVVGIVLGAAGTLFMIGLVVTVGGPTLTAVSTLLALVPLAGVLLTIRWVDRWEPEPRGILAAAFLWGAGVATAVSVLVNDTLSLVVYAATQDQATAGAVTAVVAAPLVEESVKGLGVLLIFLVRRRYFDGVVDGIVYAATVSAGFAFVENILYFVQYPQDLAAVFVMRGILSPFAHVVFTACIGVALGITARTRSGWMLAAPLGWLAAVALHAVWNGSAVLGVSTVVYASFQVPLFACLVGLVLWLRSRERVELGRRLAEYAAAGWFSRYELEMLASPSARRSARAWAARRGTGRAMREFQDAAMELAVHRQRVVTGRAHLVHPSDEHELLRRVVAARQALSRSA